MLDSVATRIPSSLRDAVFNFPGCCVAAEEQEARSGALMDTIAGLSPLHGEIIQLKFYQGLSTKEAAARMGLSQSFVGSRQRQALHHLRMAANERYRGMVGG